LHAPKRSRRGWAAHELRLDDIARGRIDGEQLGVGPEAAPTGPAFTDDAKGHTTAAEDLDARASELHPCVTNDRRSRAIPLSNRLPPPRPRESRRAVALDAARLPRQEDAMDVDTCGVCGGDGEVSHSAGASSRCPACHGTGRRPLDTGFRDVTKTKPSHHHPTNVTAKAEKQTWPSTHEGGQLAKEVKECATLSEETKARLTREIIEYESSRGRCTQTFTKKIRRQLRPPT